MRHSLPAKFFRCAQRSPSSLTILGISFLESSRRRDASVLMAGTPFEIANLMRELTYENDGAFVALEREGLMDIEREDRDRYPAPPPRPAPAGGPIAPRLPLPPRAPPPRQGAAA